MTLTFESSHCAAQENDICSRIVKFELRDSWNSNAKRFSQRSSRHNACATPQIFTVEASEKLHTIIILRLPGFERKHSP